MERGTSENATDSELRDIYQMVENNVAEHFAPEYAVEAIYQALSGEEKPEEGKARKVM